MACMCIIKAHEEGCSLGMGGSIMTQRLGTVYNHGGLKSNDESTVYDGSKPLKFSKGNGTVGPTAQQSTAQSVLLKALILSAETRSPHIDKVGKPSLCLMTYALW